jgi:cob(I)alamin adenosyltransferase
MAEEVQGLTVVFTGNGKGKTSAALGVVLRALGHGFKCKIIQFIKANKETGEYKFLSKLSPQAEIVQFGHGFTWKKGRTSEEHTAILNEGVKTAKADIISGAYQLVVLDEILYALKGGYIQLADVIDLIKSKPANMHLVLTGRDAPGEIVRMADMATNMDMLKHPIENGIPAQKGLDF